MKQLRQQNIPSMVIFYDGVNDIFSAFQQGKAGLPQNEFNREKEFKTLVSKKRSMLVFFESLQSLASVQFIKDLINPNPKLNISYTEQQLKLLAQETIDIYQENIRLVYSLGEQQDFKSLFYWQPTIFDKRNQSDYEKEKAKDVDFLKDFIKLVNQHVVSENISHQSFYYYDISEIFMDEKEPVFIDYCHVSEYGNSVIARRMMQDIISILKSEKEEEELSIPGSENMSGNEQF
jgi:hypothetical protein